MEALLDPGRRLIQEGPCGRMVFLDNATSERSNSESQGDVIPETPQVSLPVSSSPWGPPKNEDTACSRERIEAPLPPLQPRPTCERLELPSSCDVVLSGCEDLVSSFVEEPQWWLLPSFASSLAIRSSETGSPFWL